MPPGKPGARIYGGVRNSNLFLSTCISGPIQMMVKSRLTASSTGLSHLIRSLLAFLAILKAPERHRRHNVKKRDQKYHARTLSSFRQLSLSLRILPRNASLSILDLMELCHLFQASALIDAGTV